MRQQVAGRVVNEHRFDRRLCAEQKIFAISDQLPFRHHSILSSLLSSRRRFFQILQVSDSVAGGVLICDVMGHGVRAALVAAILRALVEDLRAHASEPARFLQELNRGISHILKQIRLMMFVSACYLVVDIARGELRYANAGHPTPLCVHRALRTAEPLRFDGSKPDSVLGIFDDAQYHSSSCELSAGDQLRLLQSVTQRAGLCAEELCRQLVDEVQQLAATKDFADDVCLIAMTIDHLMKD